MPYLSLGCRVVVGVVFLVALASKARPAGFRRFVRSLRRLDAVPAARVRLVAGTVATAEAAVVVLVALPARWTAVAGFVLAAGLLTAFAVAIVGTLRRGLRVPCACFGRSSAPMGPHHVVRNAALVAVAIAGAVTTRPGSGGAGGLAVAAAAGLVLGGLTTVLDDLVGLFRPLRMTGEGER